jgi:hypothetical protein
LSSRSEKLGIAAWLVALAACAGAETTTDPPGFTPFSTARATGAVNRVKDKITAATTAFFVDIVYLLGAFSSRKVRLIFDLASPLSGCC